MKLLYLILSSWILTTVSCTKADTIQDNPKDINLEESVSDFSFNTLKALSSDAENVLFSPLSLHIALSLTTMGATDNSLDNLRSILNLEDLTRMEISDGYRDLLINLMSTNDSTLLSCNNQLFYDESRITLYEEFRQLVKNGFDNGELVLDFNDPDAVNKINQWAAESTNDRIKEILKNIEDTEVLFIVNALYFTGDWKLGFDPDQTITEIFSTNDQESYNVEMMTSDDLRMSYIGDDYGAVDLYFKGDEYAMTFILSDDSPGGFLSSTDSLKQWYIDLISNKLVLQRTYLKLPRFQIVSKYLLNDVFKAIGLTEIWKGKANFSDMGISPLGPLYVSRILHDAFLKVDEKGVEGAAVTVVGIAADSAPPQLIFNRPFFFIIRHVETNTPIFAGIFNKPE
jgi:serpin B